MSQEAVDLLIVFAVGAFVVALCLAVYISERPRP